MLSRKILKLQVAKDAISCIFFLGGGVVGGQSVTGNELFMIIKLDVASSAVSPFSDTILFLKRLSPYCYMCTNINDRRRWLH